MYQLKSCVWEITSACTMRCIHCGTRAGEKRQEELNEDEALDAARQLMELGCKRVTLIGGEVTLSPYWARLARWFFDNGMDCEIVTNGYHKTEQDYKDILNARLTSVAVSIDGMDSLHNEIRGREDAFYETERFCHWMKKMEVPLTAVTTITRKCVGQLEEMYQWLGSKGVRVWQWQQVSPMGKARNKDSLGLRQEDVVKVFDCFAVLKKQPGPHIVLADNLGYYAERENQVLRPFQGCAAGLSVIGLDSVGNVRGCESLYDDYFIEGNLREKTLREIWASPAGFAYNRQFRPELLSGKCAHCEMGDVCAGGCRSFGAFHGTLYEHENCIREANLTMNRQ